MKTIKLIPIIICILVLIVGCKKSESDPVVPDPVIPPPPVLTVTAPQGVIPYGDPVTISWSAEGVISSVTLNNKPVDRAGSFTIERLLENETYSLNASGPGGQVNKTITLTVGDWKSSTFGLLTNGYWLFVGAGYKSPSVMNDYYMWTEYELRGSPWYDQKTYFTKEGRFIIYELGKVVANVGFNLLNMRYVLDTGDGGSLYDIEKINETEFVSIGHTTEFYDSDGDGIVDAQRPSLFKKIYKRAK